MKNFTEEQLNQIAEEYTLMKLGPEEKVLSAMALDIFKDGFRQAVKLIGGEISNGVQLRQKELLENPKDS